MNQQYGQEHQQHHQEQFSPPINIETTQSEPTLSGTDTVTSLSSVSK